MGVEIILSEDQKYDLQLVDRLTLLNQGRGGNFRFDEVGIMIIGN